MKNEYKALFDKVAPIKSDEELFNAVLERKAENRMSKRKFSKKVIVIPAAAAAVMAITTISVSAAYQRSTANSLKEVYDSKPTMGYEATPDTTNTVAKTMDEASGFDFSSVGHKEINQVIDCTGVRGSYGWRELPDGGMEQTEFQPEQGTEMNFKMDVIGVAADKNNVFLLYDLIFDEGFDYSLAPGEEWMLDGHCAPTNAEGLRASGFTDSFIGMEGNVAHCVWRADFDGNEGFDTKGLHFDYRANELCRNGNRDEAVGPLSEGEMYKVEGLEFEFDIDFDNDANTLSLTPDVNADFHCDENGGNYSAQVKALTVTPLSLSGIMTWNDPSKYWTDMDEVGGKASSQMVGRVKVTMKDGTVYQQDDYSTSLSGEGVTAYDEDGNITEVTANLAVRFDQPVNTGEIQSITVGDAVIEVNK